ncbi:MAG: FtsX-like permease family protein [Terriglobales bacterium]|jgi:putative ABC transport system permease protein
MTLTRFMTKSAFRNKRRSILTVLSITFSLLLLTLMMTIWRAFYIDTFSAESAQRLVTRHRVSLTESMPLFYREKIRAIPGVVAVAPNNWFGGIYKDDKPENMFAQFGTDPDEILKIFTDCKIPADQLLAWQRDRAGAIVDDHLVKKYGWKLGDRIVIKGTIYPVDLELTIRGIYTAPESTESIYFNQKYVEEAVSFARGKAGMFDILADSPDDVSKVASAVDAMFRNSPEPTKTESEKAFQLGFINSIGNVKAFILSICFAVVFATLLVSATTMAMSIRERTREVAVLKTLGFTRQSILQLYIGEAVLVSLTGGALGCLLAIGLVSAISHAPGMNFFLSGVKVTPPTLLVAIFVAGMVGFLSAILPAYHAAGLDIVEGLRHIG